MSVSAQGFFETAKGDEIKLPRLSTRYFAFEFPDDTSAVVGFFNGLNFAVRLQTLDEWGDVFSAQPPGSTPKGAHVKALLKIGGQWKEEDWTGRRYVSFCRQKDSEKLESLIVILSNSSIDTSNDLVPQGNFSPMVWTSNFGCGAWEGSANLTFKWEGQAVTETMTVTGIGFQSFGDGQVDDGTPLFRTYINSAGSYSWKVSGGGQGCSYSGQAAGPLGLLRPGSAMLVHPWVVSGPAHRAFDSSLFAEWLLPMYITETCGSPPRSEQIYWPPNNHLLYTTFDDAWKMVSRDGRTWDVDASKIGVTGLSGTWHFAVKRTP